SGLRLRRNLYWRGKRKKGLSFRGILGTVSKRLGCRLPVLMRGLHPDRQRAEGAIRKLASRGFPDSLVFFCESLRRPPYFFSVAFSTGILNCSGRSRRTRRSQASG